MYNGPVVRLALSHCLDIHATKLDGLGATLVQNRDGPDYDKDWTRKVANSTKPRVQIKELTDSGANTHPLPFDCCIGVWRNNK